MKRVTREKVIPRGERYRVETPVVTVEPGETVLVDGHHYLIHDARVRLLRPPADGGGRSGG